MPLHAQIVDRWKAEEAEDRRRAEDDAEEAVSMEAERPRSTEETWTSREIEEIVRPLGVETSLRVVMAFLDDVLRRREAREKESFNAPTP